MFSVNNGCTFGPNVPAYDYKAIISDFKEVVIDYKGRITSTKEIIIDSIRMTLAGMS